MKRSISIFGQAAGLLLGAVLLPLVAHAADDSGVYAALSVGQTQYNVNACDTGCTIDETHTAYSGGVGYHFNQGIAVEGGYANLGEFSMTLGGGLKGSEKIDGEYFDAVGTLPISAKIALNGSIGEYFWSGSESCNFSGCGSENSHDVFYGIGAIYHLTQAASIGLIWNYYELNSAKANSAQVISARFVYGF